MPNIRVDLESPLFHGQNIIFKSPTDCSTVTGLIAYYPEGKSVVSRVFQFADAHGNNVGSVSLFSENVLVKVILDTELNRAYVQNSDTNAYLEGQFASKAPIGLVHQVLSGGSSLSTLHSAILTQFKSMKESTVRLFVVSFSSSYSPFIGQKTTLTVQKLSASSGVIKADLHENAVLDTPAMTLWNVIINNELDEWEYNNPPFIKNTEYRTTERILGKAVYKRLTDVGIEYRLDGSNEWNSYVSLLGKTYTHPTTHPASMITETDAIKMMTSEERTKLAGIEAFANKYVHPSTHPASMITGLAETISSLGYGKVSCGTYVGNGAGTITISSATGSSPSIKSQSSLRTIELGFTPNVVLLFGHNSSGELGLGRSEYAGDPSRVTDFLILAQGVKHFRVITVTSEPRTYRGLLEYVSGSKLYLAGNIIGCSMTSGESRTNAMSNYNGRNYYWIAF